MSLSGHPSMSVMSATVLYQLAENAHQLDNIGEMVLFIQQQFVSLFKTKTKTDSLREAKPTVTSIASTEEEKLLTVRAVERLHTMGLQRHREFFQSESYHPSAAFFIYELLGSLSGDKQCWFQQLRVESLRACTAIVSTVGRKTVRLCLPGIVSACVKYIDRATQGIDAFVVRIAAVELLRTSLTISLVTQEGDDTKWLQDTVTNLGHGMARLLAPKVLTCEGMTLPFAQELLRLVTDVLLLLPLGAFRATLLVRELLVGCFILSNLLFFLNGDVSEFVGKIRGLLLSFLRDTKKEGPVVLEIVRAQLGQLRGVELLHFASALLRCKETRAEAFCEDDRHKFLLCYALQQCVYLVGTAMSVESLYCAKSSRESLCHVVDEFIQCAAYALASMYSSGGAQVLETFMDDCEATLADWDLYMLHPPIIYVLTRLVVWRFKTPAWMTEAKGCDGEEDRQPVEVLVLSGIFEQLWSIVSQPHLWNITEDEQLCTWQQLQHRQTVAASILCSVELVAMLLRDEPVVNKARRKRAVQRLNVLTLYLVLEKAAGSAVVHDVAMRVIGALCEAGCYTDTLTFLIDQSGFIVDEASRAVTEESLRASAASVLRGGVSFIQRNMFTGSCRGGFSACTLRQWVDAIRNAGHASSEVVDVAAVPRVSDFVASAIKVASDGCRRATLQEDETGAIASVVLLADCFSVAATLNRCVPQLGTNEEQDRMTTAAEPRVQILQLAVLEAVRMLLAYCTRNDAVAPFAIRAITRGLTVFLTTPKAETWMLEAEDADNQPPPVFAWEEKGTVAVLPRGHLRTVYQVYLSFMAILSEPVALFALTSASRRRSAQERRALEDVRPTPAVLLAMEGLEAIFLLATDFLSRRVVEEVLPVVLTWHERGALPRIPTKTDEKVQMTAIKFLQNVCAIDSSVGNEISATCAGLLPYPFPATVAAAAAAANVEVVKES